MRRSGRTLAALVAAACAIPAAAGAESDSVVGRSVGPAVIVLGNHADLGSLQRPAVEFDHAAHATALRQEGCASCHRVDRGLLMTQFAPVESAAGRDAVLDAYHVACVGCHRDRASAGAKAGPAVCSGCHTRRPAAISTRAAMEFDLSLHARHAQAFPEACGTCHHERDEATGALRYTKGAEEACRACHLEERVDDVRALRPAVHQSCVGCHLQRTEAGQATGPISCVGCHDAAARQGVKVLDEVPRLMRGQRDRMWIRAEGARSRVVPLDHQLHEGAASFCTSCHHRGLKPCATCHTLAGVREGAGVTLSAAFHSPGASQSCVGCHARTMAAPECAGCHETVARLPGESSCVACHSGPLPEQLDPEAAVVLAAVRLGDLATDPEAMPDEVVISVLEDEYQASRLPHRKIVARLDASVRASRLAARFHGSTERLCAGCHHHSPVGERPPACRSCHGDASDPVRDRPALKAAYHQQCIGCHRRMGIGKEGCTDCHAAKEVTP